MGFTEKTMLSTEFGELECRYFYKSEGEFCLVLLSEPLKQPPLVRIHSSCLFSESFQSNDCDCALQLEASQKEIAKQGGIIVYLFQEGRGIGLEGKMRAITLERTEGINTAEAFHKLGFKPDPRSYELASDALKALGIGPEIILASNNPAKISEIEKHGFTVTSRYKLEYETNSEIEKYLTMKQKALNHYEAD